MDPTKNGAKRSWSAAIRASAPALPVNDTFERVPYHTCSAGPIHINPCRERANKWWLGGGEEEKKTRTKPVKIKRRLKSMVKVSPSLNKYWAMMSPRPFNIAAVTDLVRICDERQKEKVS